MVAEDTKIEPWIVACAQANFEHCNPNVKGEFEGETLKKRNLNVMCTYIDACFNSPFDAPIKLICFPEFSIGGMYNSRTTTEEVKKYQAISIPGPETEVLATKAKEYGVYIAAVNHENDPLRPDFFFNTAFIINPQGKIILKYRKLNTIFGCNPHDIFDEYINPITGTREFFPVVDTKIGRLSCGICSDVWLPEIPKIYSIKGADVWLHLTSGRSWDNGTCMLRTRAIDNTIYIVHENFASLVLSTETIGDIKIPTHHSVSHGGGSMVIDYHGRVLAEAISGTTEQLVMAQIDVMSLRETRSKPRWVLSGNAVSLTRTELYAPFYNRTIFPPNETIKHGPMKHINDESAWDRRYQAARNVTNNYDFYSEDEVK